MSLRLNWQHELYPHAECGPFTVRVWWGYRDGAHGWWYRICEQMPAEVVLYPTCDEAKEAAEKALFAACRAALEKEA